MSCLLFLVNVDGHLYYNIFYLIAFLAIFVLLIKAGIKENYHPASWLLMVAGLYFIFISGSKLFSYSWPDWQVMFTNQRLLPTINKTLLGGLILLLPGFVILKKLLKFKTETLDAFALVIPVGIAIQRIGCFLAGCCYGTSTTMPWGVQYAKGTLPHFHQFTESLVQATDLYSLPVHPSQLYETLNGLLVVVILLLVKRFIKAPGNFLTASVLFYCLFRFVTEFFRSLPLEATGSLPGGLKIVQWILLGMVVFLTVLFIYREKYHTKTASSAPAVPTPSSISLSLLLGLIVGTWGLRNWFTLSELLILNLILLPTTAWVSVYYFKTAFAPNFRWLALSLFILPVILTSQVSPTQTTPAKPDSVYHTVKIGYISGTYHNSHTIGGSGICSNSNTKYFKQEFTVGAVGYALTKQEEKMAFTYGVNAFAGKHQETEITNKTSGKTQDITLINLNPYARLDRKWYGLGAGIHVGNLLYTLENTYQEGSGTPDWGSNQLPFYPQASLRVGPLQWFFADIRIADQFPSPFPGMRYQVGIGSGLGAKNGTFFKYGVTGINESITANIVLNRVVLEPHYQWGKAEGPYLNNKKHHIFSMGLHYRFKL